MERLTLRHERVDFQAWWQGFSSSWRKTCAIRFGRRPHPVCFADVPLLRKERETSPCRSATSLSFNKERDVSATPKQGEVMKRGVLAVAETG